MRLTIVWNNEKRDFDCNEDTLHGALQKCGVLFMQPCGKGICKGCRASISREDGEFKTELVCQSRFDCDMTIVLPQSGVKVDWDLKKDTDTEENKNTSKDPNKKKSNLGLAVDIGTTTVGFALCSSDDMGIASFALSDNPQIKYGWDVITRMEMIRLWVMRSRIVLMIPLTCFAPQWAMTEISLKGSLSPAIRP